MSRLQSFSKQVLAEHVFGAFKVLSSRAKLLKKYATVFDSDAAWREVEFLLQAAFGGTEMAPPPLADGAQLPALAPQLVPWWIRRWVVPEGTAGYSALSFQARHFLSEGKNKIFVFYGALGLLLVSVVYLGHGPSELPEQFWRRRDREHSEEEGLFARGRAGTSPTIPG